MRASAIFGRTSRRCHAFAIETWRFSARLRDGIAVAVVSPHTHFLDPTMPLLSAIRRTLYVLLSARFIDMQKKPANAR
jgi:hypothetical protein